MMFGVRLGIYIVHWEAYSEEFCSGILMKLNGKFVLNILCCEVFLAFRYWRIHVCFIQYPTTRQGKTDRAQLTSQELLDVASEWIVGFQWIPCQKICPLLHNVWDDDWYLLFLLVYLVLTLRYPSIPWRSGQPIHSSLLLDWMMRIWSEYVLVVCQEVIIKIMEWRFSEAFYSVHLLDIKM